MYEQSWIAVRYCPSRDISPSVSALFCKWMTLEWILLVTMKEETSSETCLFKIKTHNLNVQISLSAKCGPLG